MAMSVHVCVCVCVGNVCVGVARVTEQGHKTKGKRRELHITLTDELTVKCNINSDCT